MPTTICPAALTAAGRAMALSWARAAPGKAAVVPSVSARAQVESQLVLHGAVIVVPVVFGFIEEDLRDTARHVADACHANNHRRRFACCEPKRCQLAMIYVLPVFSALIASLPEGRSCADDEPGSILVNFVR